jgi:hypothetical protein
MVEEYSWTAAVNMMIDATEGGMPHYIPGTYDFSNHERVK